MKKGITKPKAPKPSRTKVAAELAESVSKAISFTLYLSDAKLIHDATACCISHEETRYYLNGVCLDSSEEGLLAISTDGHRLARLVVKPLELTKDERDRDVWQARTKPLDEKFSVIVPTPFIKRLGALPKQSFLIERCTITIEDGWIHYRDPNEGFSAKLIDGNYPDWRKVYPKETLEQPPTVALNPRYVSEIMRASKKAHGRPVAVALNIKSDHDPVVVHAKKDTIDLSYVLMPMRF